MVRMTGAVVLAFILYVLYDMYTCEEDKLSLT